MNKSFIKKFLKRTLLIVLAIFICFVIYFYIAFFGNPVSKFLVKNSAQKYINENYPKLNLEIRDIFYTWDGDYSISLHGKNSKDIYFRIYFDKYGRHKRGKKDIILSDILSNTYERFSDELKNYGKNLEKDLKTPYEINLSTIVNSNEVKSKLKIDQEVDFNNFPLSVDAGAYTFAENPNYEEALKILKNLQAVMDSTPLKVTKYNIILVPEKDSDACQTLENALKIYDIPADFLRTADEQDLMEYRKKMDEYSKWWNKSVINI